MNSIILDTDPGIDDAVAMVVLARECARNILLLYTTYGNTSLENASDNALAILSLLNEDIPVIKGAARPLNPDYQNADYIHGSNGLGGIALPEAKGSAIQTDAMFTVYQAIIACETVDYITLGPLTNLAELIKHYPDVTDHIDRVVSMGGGIGMGNVTKFAEFNIHCDAESANYVIDHVKSFALVPLNVTSKVAFSPHIIDAVGKIGTPLAKFMQEILTVNYNNCVSYGEAGSTMHDSVAVLYYLYPELFNTKNCSITVDEGAHYGETIISADSGNVTLVTECSAEVMLSKIFECIKRPKNNKHILDNYSKL